MHVVLSPQKIQWCYHHKQQTGPQKKPRKDLLDYCIVLFFGLKTFTSNAFFCCYILRFPSCAKHSKWVVVPEYLYWEKIQKLINKKKCGLVSFSPFPACSVALMLSMMLSLAFLCFIFILNFFYIVAVQFHIYLFFYLNWSLWFYTYIYIPDIHTFLFCRQGHANSSFTSFSFTNRFFFLRRMIRGEKRH